MGLAAVMYAQDYDERLVPAYMDDNVGSGRTWYLIWYGQTGLVAPYMMNAQVFHCPSSKGQAYTGGTRTDYGINYRICRSRGSAAMSEIKYPAETIIMADSDWTRSTADYGCSNCWRLNIGFHPSFFIPARHNGGANITFCDGHAKWHQILLDPSRGYVGPIKFTHYPRDICWGADGYPKY